MYLGNDKLFFEAHLKPFAISAGILEHFYFTFGSWSANPVRWGVRALEYNPQELVGLVLFAVNVHKFEFSIELC